VLVLRDVEPEPGESSGGMNTGQNWFMNGEILFTFPEPPCADPHARWCGERGLITPAYPIKQSDVWDKLDKFTKLMAEVNADMRKSMENGKASREQMREAMLLAASGCGVIREACQQLVSSENGPIVECSQAPKCSEESIPRSLKFD
jgi:hypothetical protein